jgi:phage-related tail protein
MEPTEEFSTTPLSDIRSALERIELIVNELNDKTDQIYYAQDREELMKQIKNLGNVIQLLSDQIGVLKQENGRLIKKGF